MALSSIIHEGTQKIWSDFNEAYILEKGLIELAHLQWNNALFSIFLYLCYIHGVLLTLVEYNDDFLSLVNSRRYA